MNRREDFIKFIPKPKNEDVILYDISLKELIDVDVVKEYNDLYPIFINKKNEYENLKTKINIYKKTIDSIYLFNPSWTEQDYLLSLQNDKKTYSNLYNNIKKYESNIEILKKKVKGIDEKIQIQLAMENKKNEAKKNDINKDIEKNKEKLSNYKIYIDSYKQTLNLIEEKIKDNQSDFELFVEMEQNLENGEYKCPCCDTLLNSKSIRIHNKLLKKIEKNKADLEKILSEKEKVELNLSYYEDELSKIKSQLNNDINFKKESNNFYIKKSIEILKLEALKDEMLNNISELEKNIKSDSNVHTKKYSELKERILKYETSLNNFRRVKEMKEELKTEMNNYHNKETELKEIFNKINLYIRFLTIYYKIYEQKANEYCGKDYKFSFFKVENYKIIEVFELTYKGINYYQLSKEQQDEVDKNLIEKFSIYF